MSRLTRVSLAAVMAAVVVGTGSGATPAGPAQAAAPSCDRQIIILPPLPADGSARVSAMNSRGWVVGTSSGPPFSPSAAVLWRGTGAPRDLRLGGATLANGDQTSGQPVDVNERGVVAVQRNRLNAKATRVRSTSAWLWRDGVRTRLPGTANRRWAMVESVNDHGVAAGWIHGRRGDRRIPVVWRKGVLTRLPLPRGATGQAVENNNLGLVIGSVTSRDGQSWTPWWWRLGGRSGPLRTLENSQFGGETVDVDDRGRIIGVAPRGVLWRQPNSVPKRILGRYDMAAMSNRGDVTGTRRGFRGIGGRASVARLSGRNARLPDPQTEDGDIWWENTFGSDLARGVTAFAPQGGVTVGGSASGDDGRSRAVLWTCAQTYLP